MRPATPVVTRHVQSALLRHDNKSTSLRRATVVVIALLLLLAGLLSLGRDVTPPAVVTLVPRGDMTGASPCLDRGTLHGASRAATNRRETPRRDVVTKRPVEEGECRRSGWLPTRLPLQGLPLLVNATVETRWRDRRPSAPFITGDGFRASARFIFDETTAAAFRALTIAFEAMGAASAGDRPAASSVSRWALREALTEAGCPPRVAPFPVGNPYAEQRWWAERSQRVQTLAAATAQVSVDDADAASQALQVRALVAAALAPDSSSATAEADAQTAQAARARALEYVRAVAPVVSFHCLVEGDAVFVQTDHLDEFASVVLGRARSRATGVHFAPADWGRLPSGQAPSGQPDGPLANHWQYPTFSLITHNGDRSAPSERGGNERGVEQPAEASNYTLQREQILESRRVRRWYAQNWVLDPAREQAWLRASGHPQGQITESEGSRITATKGRPIPIGLENRYNKQGRLVAVYADVLGLSALPTAAVDVAENGPSSAPTHDVTEKGNGALPPPRAVDARPLTAFYVGSNPQDRGPALAAMRRNFPYDWHPLHAFSDFMSNQYASWVHGKDAKQRVGLAQYLRRVSRTAYTMAPRGNGVDCHRTWESLYAGSVPIVRRGAMDPRLLALLPVALVGRRDSVDATHASEPLDATAYAAVTPDWVRATWGRLCQRPVVLGDIKPTVRAPPPPAAASPRADPNKCDGDDANDVGDSPSESGVTFIMTRSGAFAAARAAIERPWDPTSPTGVDPEAEAMHPALLDMSFWAWAIQQQ